MSDLKALRLSLRQLRRQIANEQCRAAQRAVFDAVLSLPLYRSAQRLGGYWASDGELDTSALLTQAQADGKNTYLPIITALKQPLAFAPFTDTTLMQPNRYGIPEPQVSQNQLIQANELDLVLTPLVAFDDAGRRLGMGGGFYDRSFELSAKRPFLLGVAFELQHVDYALPQRDWDVRLDAAVTEAGIYHWPNNNLANNPAS
jgi:5-formyltetrahydrofolate cyclo-ligase